jgi:hypothetical protein
VPVNGAIADAIGLQKSLMTHVILVIVTIGIAWFLPREGEMERYAAGQEPVPMVSEPVTAAGSGAPTVRSRTT